MRSSRLLGLLAAIVGAGTVANTNGPSGPDEKPRTILGTEGPRFTLNGRPTFLLGISYYGGLGAPESFNEADLDDLQRHGFNWVRIWATWAAFDQDISVVDENGGPKAATLAKLRGIVAACDRRGIVVDVTLARGKADRPSSTGLLPDAKAHRAAVAAIVRILKPYRNWYLDLANEHDVRDDRHVGDDELRRLRLLARQLSPELLVTASFGGHDLGEDDVRAALLEVGVDFLAVHRPRTAESPSQTEARTRECLALARKVGRVVPVHHQEPFRRGYGRWEPQARDFRTDLRGAVDGGAAGWCLHNGQQGGTPDGRPGRSFDLRAQRLFDQLDEEEQAVVREAAAVINK